MSPRGLRRAFGRQLERVYHLKTMFKETTGGEFRVYRASVRLLYGI